LLGFGEEELRGKHCVQFSPPDDAEKDWARRFDQHAPTCSAGE
jgi:hypothetical protein